MESFTSWAEKIWPNTSKHHLACRCTCPWAVGTPASWKHTSSRYYQYFKPDIEQSTMGFCLFRLLSAVLLCLSHGRDEICHCHPELLKELKPWCPTFPENTVAARLPRGFLFPAGSALLLWYDPENANGSGPKHCLEHLLKFKTVFWIRQRGGLKPLSRKTWLSELPIYLEVWVWVSHFFSLQWEMQNPAPGDRLQQRTPQLSVHTSLPHYWMFPSSAHPFQGCIAFLTS